MAGWFGGDSDASEHLSVITDVQTDPARSHTVAEHSVTFDDESETGSGELIWLIEDDIFFERVPGGDWQQTDAVAIKTLWDLTGLDGLHRQVAESAGQFTFVGETQINGVSVGHFEGPLIVFSSEFLVDNEFWWAADPFEEGSRGEVWVDESGLIVAYRGTANHPIENFSFQGDIELSLDFSQPTTITIPESG